MSENFSEWLTEQFNLWEKSLGKRRQTVSGFARYLGVKQPTLNRWMNGDNLPDTDGIKALARKLGTEVYKQLGQSEPIYTRVYSYSTRLSEEERAKVFAEVDQILSENPPENIFEREAKQKQLFLERGIINLSIHFEQAYKNDDISYLIENWDELPEFLRKQILSDVQKYIGDTRGSESTTQTPRLAANSKL